MELYFLPTSLKIFLYFRKKLAKFVKQKITAHLVCIPNFSNNEFNNYLFIDLALRVLRYYRLIKKLLSFKSIKISF